LLYLPEGSLPVATVTDIEQQRRTQTDEPNMHTHAWQVDGIERSIHNCRADMYTHIMLTEYAHPQSHTHIHTQTHKHKHTHTSHIKQLLFINKPQKNTYTTYTHILVSQAS
jgi:hypothetical protein